MTAAERAERFTDSLRHKADEEKQRELDGDWLKHVEHVNGVDAVYKPEFEWPCYKRTAHGPHWIPATGAEHEVECLSPVACGCGEQCDGLPAHPLTQIGGNYAQEDIPG